MFYSSFENRLESLMADTPFLSDFGLGHYYGTPKIERAALLAENRRRLLGAVTRVGIIIDWLAASGISKIKSMNRNRTSYGYKHIVEKRIGYITNGQFIAAAILAGFNYETKGPNAYFNMSEKDWNRIIKTTPRHQLALSHN